MGNTPIPFLECYPGTPQNIHLCTNKGFMCILFNTSGNTLKLGLHRHYFQKEILFRALNICYAHFVYIKPS
jgi:hypothetical protein